MNLIEKAVENCNLIFAPDYLGAFFYYKTLITENACRGIEDFAKL